MSASFKVSVQFGGHPLEDAVLVITHTASLGEPVKWTYLTDRKGFAFVPDLPPGEYWMSGTYLGSGLTEMCFHVPPSREGKGALKFHWGDYAESAAEARGTVRDKESVGQDFIWRVRHPVSVPIGVASLRLENALTRDIVTTTTRDDGSFDFGEIPPGVYVLTIEAESQGRRLHGIARTINIRPGGFYKQLNVDWVGSMCGAGWEISRTQTPRPPQ